jgi:hypothetical protein
MRHSRQWNQSLHRFSVRRTHISRRRTRLNIIDRNRPRSSEVLSDQSVGARYESLIRLADSIRAQSGQIEEEDIAELGALISSEAKGRRIVLDLKNLTLVGQDAIAFLDRCEANGITLKNCPAYIREWIKGLR